MTLWRSLNLGVDQITLKGGINVTSRTALARVCREICDVISPGEDRGIEIIDVQMSRCIHSRTMMIASGAATGCIGGHGADGVLIPTTVSPRL